MMSERTVWTMLVIGAILAIAITVIETLVRWLS